MDESLHWVLSLTALGLWVLAVWAVYFFIIRRQLKDIENVSSGDRAELLKTRRQRDLEI